MKISEQKRIVIVDGYSTGRDLVRELANRGAACLHLQSTEHLPPPVAKSFDRTPYDGDLGYVGDVEEAVEVLSTLAPNAVIAGSEWGVSFAERVAHGLGLPTNRAELTSARRDKFDMVEAVRRHGLRAAEQATVTTCEAAHAWASSHAAWPIVVKPICSAGSDGVSICSSHADIDAAFAKTFGRENFMGSRNDRLLVQSFLAGPQFIVNTVSCGGRHFVTDMWRMTVMMRDSLVVPGEIYLLDPTHPAPQALIEYTLDVLEALGIENGAAHTELKWTPNGPALVETGARVMGAAMDAPSYRAAELESHAMTYARILAATDDERDIIFSKRHYTLVRPMAKVLFNFTQPGRVRGVAGLERLRDLPSFHAHYRPLAVGATVWRTADWLCCGGVIYLVHDDPKQIDSDIESIRELEERGALYDLVPINGDGGDRP